MRLVYSTAGILGRMFLSILFIVSAIQYLVDFSNKEQRFFSILSMWAQNEHVPVWIREFFAQMLSWSTVLFGLGLAILLLAGLFVFLGVQVRFGAFLLVLFVAVKILLICPIWMRIQETECVLLFLNNASIIGGLLVLFSVGKHKQA